MRSMLSPTGRGSSSPSSFNADARRKKRNITTRVACNECRARKQACDGVRPTCSRCRRRGVEACEYDTEEADESRNEAMRKENQRLKTRLKDYEDAWRSLGHAPLLYSAGAFFPAYVPPSPSEHSTLRALLPPTRSRLEYQLMLSHPTLFPCIAPIHGSKLPLRPSILIDPGSKSETAPTSPTDTFSEAGGSKTPAAVLHLPSPKDLANLVPHSLRLESPAAALPASSQQPPCDPRLSQLDIGFWTDVPVANSKAIDILALFLLSEQPLIGFFDADLVVGDLVAKRLRHCSPFLVSSLLYWASHAYQVLRPDPSLAAFGIEAKKRWASDQHSRQPYTAVTIVATFIFSMCASANGLSDVGNEAMAQAMHMANSLGWFGHPIDTSRHLDSDAADALRMDSHVAWGMFNYTTMTSFTTQRLMMTSPPVFPMPGDGGIIGFDRDTGQPLHHLLPPYMGKTFTAACQFYLIANEITLSHLSEDETVSRNKLSLKFAESVYQRLINWSDQALPPFTEDASGNGLGDILHMWVHSRILDLLRPFLSSPIRLQTFAYLESTTEDVYHCSLNQLKRHVLMFPLRYASAAHCAWFNVAIMQTTSCVITDAFAPDVRFWFGVCTRAMLSLNRAYPLLTQILDVFVRMAVKSGIISSQEASSIMRHGFQPMTRASMTGDYVLDLNLALTSRDKARMDQLASTMEATHIDSDSTPVGKDEPDEIDPAS